MSENKALKLCQEVFPKLSESDSFEKLRQDVYLSPMGVNAIFKKVDELGRELSMPSRIESSLSDTTHMALMAEGCKLEKAKAELSKEDKEFVWKNKQKADELVAESVFQHGSDKFAAVLKLENATKSELTGQWNPNLTNREKILKHELELRSMQVLVLPQNKQNADKPDFYLYARPSAKERAVRMDSAPIISPFLFR